MKNDKLGLSWAKLKLSLNLQLKLELKFELKLKLLATSSVFRLTCSLENQKTED